MQRTVMPTDVDSTTEESGGLSVKDKKADVGKQFPPSFMPAGAF